MNGLHGIRAAFENLTNDDPRYTLVDGIKEELHGQWDRTGVMEKVLWNSLLERTGLDGREAPAQAAMINLAAGGGISEIVENAKKRVINSHELPGSAAATPETGGDPSASMGETTREPLGDTD
jgi:hypothetical protein